MAAAKKHEAHKAEPSSAKASTDAKAMVDKPEGQGKEVTNEPKKEAVVVSDTVTETTERIEVVEEVTHPEDPLTDFKEKMSEEEEQPVSSVSPQKNFMWPILFVVFLALVSMIGIFIYKQNANKTEEVNIVTLSPTPTIMPQPTKTIDLSKYPIEILNGSGISGEASRQKEGLEKEGFTVSSIGNAANANYTETIIQAKENVDKAFLDKLKSVLEESFVVGGSEELPQDADSDVILIIGSEKK